MWKDQVIKCRARGSVIKIILVICSSGGSSLQEARAGGSLGRRRCFLHNTVSTPTPSTIGSSATCRSARSAGVRCRRRMGGVPRPALPGGSQRAEPHAEGHGATPAPGTGANSSERCRRLPRTRRCAEEPRLWCREPEELPGRPTRLVPVSWLHFYLSIFLLVR